MSTFLFFFLSFLSFGAFAQEFKYHLEGSFATSANPETMEPTIVNYSMNWNETTSAIQGIYQDNYFAKDGPKTLSGTVANNGRTFNVIFSEEINEVKSITFKTIQTGLANGSIPITITTRNNIGVPIDAPNTFALMTTRNLVDQNPDDSTCILGFGALTGYCGLYNGTIREISDTRDRCNLLTTGNARLELATNTSFNFYPNYLAGNTNLEVHNIGNFLPSPQNSSINISSRVCTSIPGTTFVDLNCKILNLTGVFFEQITTVLFTGTYTITDEVNGDFCSHGMNLTREVPY